MNSHAIYHRAESNYCFATDRHTVILRLRMAQEDVPTKVFVEYQTKYDFASHRHVAPMQRKCADGLYAYYETQLNLDDSRLAYVFSIDDNNKRYTYCEDGLIENYNYDLGYFNFFQIAYINPADVHKVIDWVPNAVFYQIFVDRFNRGGVDKDNSYINLKWGESPTSKSFAGGDLDGIREKLDYLSNLGINALYLTPVFCSNSNHKYDTYNYFTVDEMFGGNEALKRLVDDAHSHGMKVMLDAVFNHCSEAFAQFADVVKNGKKSPYFDWFIIHGDKPDKKKLNYECFASCNYMPKFNTNNKQVREFLCNVGVYWIEQYGIDGWRLDVSDEVSHDFWREFRKAIKAANSNAVLIGENWHDAQAFLLGEQFDGTMNYAFTKVMLDLYKSHSITAVQVAERLNMLLMRYTYNASYMMFNLLDSHDTYRFYSEVGCNSAKVLAALAIEVFFLGATNVYYGTEILMEGGYDPDCRRVFDWTRCQEKEITIFFKKVATLLKLKHTDTLGRGAIDVVAQGTLLLIRRQLKQKQLQLVVNCDGNEVRFDTTENVVMSDGFDGNTISPYGFMVLGDDQLIGK